MHPVEITKCASLSPPIEQHHTLMEIRSRKNFARLTNLIYYRTLHFNNLFIF